MRDNGTQTRKDAKRKKLALPRQLEQQKKARRQGQPVPAPLKAYALQLLAAGETKAAVAHLIGVSSETVRLWCNGVEDGTDDGDHELGSNVEGSNGTSPGGEGNAHLEAVRTDLSPLGIAESGKVTSGLSPVEVEAILELKRKHPSMQSAQIRAQLKRFKGWRVSIRAVGRVLKANGYETVHRGSRPKGQENPGSFEAPYRNALWQMDFAELRVGDEKTPLLLAEDDFSRYIVIAKLMPEPTSELVVEELEAAIKRHGRPDGLYTDRGGPFIAWGKPSSLGQFLDEQLIDHHVTASYRPQGRGKIEALVATVRRELWDVVHFESLEEAQGALERFIAHYNYGRAHMGIGGLTPADRFLGRWEEVKTRMENECRRRQGAFVYGHGTQVGYSEEPDSATGAIEALRLVLVEDRVELRLFGHRVELGQLKF
ncbi:MAG: transposase [Armatimonadetes bacterium]|nr:transposase [Armatimonadota bacterium]